MNVPKGKQEPLQSVKEPLDVEKKNDKGLKNFTIIFEKYAKGNTEELSVLMKEPVKTSGQATVSSIEEKNVFETKQKGVTGVQVSVNFKDKAINFLYTEDFSLWLTKTENSYFVQELKHYYTEKAGDK